MRNLKLLTPILLAFLSSSLNANDILKEQELGQILFFDKNLSKNRTQSCATCHNPNTGFVDERENGVSKMASLGDDEKSLGDRQAPTASYAKFSPSFHFDEKKQKYIGGQFWDGRAATLEEQAGGPPLNPIEMGMKDKKEVVERLKENSLYIESFQKIYGKDIFKNEEVAYEAMTKAIASFERSDEFSPFDSKYDRHLKGEYDLTPLEDLGKSIFFSNNNNSCAKCHVLKGEDKKGETFTNYEYHNIGTPANHSLREKNGVKTIDEGLLANPNVTDESQKGKYKVPTLRNVAVTAPYMHNGVFADLKTVVEFYDKYSNKERTINPETKKVWDEPEVKENISLEELRTKALNDRKVEALVAFMKLLTDKKYEHLLEK
ncbi:cytochrome-c peroxidase [Arcobacter aquimarinus]|uniref:cytochrome-c peroxidase n=1 Tax=Arcobacter aquimarinus TaxID=1315211 RepID=UPI00353C3B6A